MPLKRFESESRALARKDKVIARLLKAHGPCVLGREGRRQHFQALARAVCFQQLAGKAAETIHGRFVAVCGGRPSPERVAALDLTALRSAGLSGSKAASIQDLAAKALDGTLVLDRIARASDDEVVERLTQVRGIGTWTAHMFLMFELHRPDVWPTGDYGVRKGYATAWKLDEMPAPGVLEGLGERFRPYRSLAAWYCWRALSGDGW